MSYDLFKGRKGKFFFLMTQVQQLKALAEKSKPSKAESILLRYEVLKDQLFRVDKNAKSFLLEVLYKEPLSNTQLLENIKSNIDQLDSYITMKLFPDMLSFAEAMQKFGKKSKLDEILPYLGRMGLDTRWIVGATTLCLMEVLTYQKLKQKKIKPKPSFKEKINQLDSIARKQGIQLDKLLAVGFWVIRNKIVHEGENLTDREVERIIDHFKQFYSDVARIS